MAVAQRFYRKRGFRIILLVSVALLIALLSFWRIYKYRLIRRVLGTAVYKSSDGLYQIRYDSLIVDEVTGSLRVTHLQIVGDTLAYARMLRRKTHPPLLVEADIPLVTVRGVRTPRAAMNHEIVGSSLIIDSPVLTLFNGGGSSAKPLPRQGPWYAQLLGKLQLIQVDTVRVENARVTWIDFKGHHPLIEAGGISLNLFGLRMDSLNKQDTARLLFSQNLDMDCPWVMVYAKSGYYHYTMRHIRMDTRENQLAADSIAIVPLLDEVDFAKAMGIQKDRYDFWFAGVILHGLDLKQLMQGKVIARTLTIDHSGFKVYHDLSYPRAPLSKVGQYPQQLLMKLKLPICIDQVLFSDAFIEYKEKNPKSDSSGLVQFDHASATISQLTNITPSGGKIAPIRVDFKASFLNLAPVKATLVVWPSDNSGKFTVDGTLGGFEAIGLNPLTRPMGLAEVLDGKVNSVKFNLEGDNYHSRGSLLMLYRGVRVALLKKRKLDKGMKENTFKSLLAGMVVKTDNPSQGQKNREPVQITNSRDTSKSIFNLIWKSIFVGVKKTMGF